MSTIYTRGLITFHNVGQDLYLYSAHRVVYTIYESLTRLCILREILIRVSKVSSRSREIASIYRVSTARRVWHISCFNIYSSRQMSLSQTRLGLSSYPRDRHRYYYYYSYYYSYYYYKRNTRQALALRWSKPLVVVVKRRSVWAKLTPFVWVLYATYKQSYANNK